MPITPSWLIENSPGLGYSVASANVNDYTDGFRLNLCLAYDQNEVGGQDERYFRLCSWSAREGWHCYTRGIGSNVSSNLVCAENVNALSDWMIDPFDPTLDLRIYLPVIIKLSSK